MRGKLPANFLDCPSRQNIDTTTLEYLSYELVIDKNIKEGKKPYKKMEKISKNIKVIDFVKEFSKNFLSYAKHKVECWFINTVKNTSTTAVSQRHDTMVSVSDFAQNLKLSSKKETSEEYFHKTQIAIFGTVSTINVPVSDT